MTLNPDFRNVDVIIPPDLQFNLEGWTDGTETEDEALYKERTLAEKLQEDMPFGCKVQDTEYPLPHIKSKWDDFQYSKGRYPGSNDLSLLDEFVHEAPLVWLPQIIGSCVMSNTFRAYVIRQMWEIAVLGEGESYLGRSEFGPDNYAFYCPMTYGMARKRANMKGGDGLYCAPMAESLMKDGILPCSTPELIALLERLGVGNSNDYPEPQGRKGATVYRQFGNWSYLDDLKQYLNYPLSECPEVTSAEQLWTMLMASKPCFVCSMEAIHKIGTHKDGFPIHARNPRDTWSHNMAVHGAFLASDGERFFRWSNESWGADHIYNRRFDEVSSSFKSGRLTMRAIGNIQGLRRPAPVFGVV